MNIINIENITKDYGGGKGVFDLSLKVQKGECMGFLGPNGAGKTTTIRQLMGFTKPDHGSVEIFSKNCFTGASEIHGKIGYLPGEIAFMDDMTGYGFLEFMAELKGIGDKQSAEKLADYFGLDKSVLSGKLRKMSKGTKQKIGIVCAFMGNPELYILDEPTSGLDPLMQNKFIELLKAKLKGGATIFMSSHIFEEVEQICDRAAIIKNGRLASVENIRTLAGSKTKTYIAKFKNRQDAESFAGTFSGVCDNDTVTAEITGSPGAFIKNLGEYDIEDLSVESRSLEQLFMNFYKGD